MIKLTQVTIDKFKSIQKRQSVNIDSSITTIVGMNEAGKTAFLTALAKTNYFQEDSDFEFDIIQDYPRNELIDFQISKDDCNIIKCTYEISQELINKIDEDIGVGVFTNTTFSHTCHYKSETSTFEGIIADQKKFLELKFDKLILSKVTKDAIKNVSSLEDADKIVASAEGDTDFPTFKAEIK